MTPVALFGLTVCGVGFAAVFALVAEMSGAPTAERLGSALMLAAAGAVSLVGGWLVDPQTVFGVFAVGGAASTVTGLILLLAAATLTGGANRGGGTVALTVFAAGGAALAGSARDLVALLVCLEIAAVAGYALVAGAHTPRSMEAAMKYFVQGAVATGLLVLGLAVFMGVFVPGGEYVRLSTALASRPALAQSSAFAFMALVAGLAFKSGAAPFHSWAPDAYETAPSTSAALLAGAVKLGMVAALASVSYSVWIAGVSTSLPFGILGKTASFALGALALASIVVGSLIALRTASYRRMLGYAGVAQVGYALIALAAFGPASALILIATYAIATTGAFIAAEAISALRPEWDGSVEGLAGLGAHEQVLSASVALLMMSLAGLPPLLGFWGKFQVFGSVIKVASSMLGGGQIGMGVWFVVLAAAGIAGSVVALGYYGRVVRCLYFGEMPVAGDLQPAAAQLSDPSVEQVGSAAQVRDARGARTTVLVIGLSALLLGVAPLVLGVASGLAGFLFKV